MFRYAARTLLVGVVRQCDKLRIILAPAFKHQEVIVAAASIAREGAAHRWPCRVDGAATLFSIEKAADAAKVLVTFSSHGIFSAMSFAGERFLGFVKTHVVMFGQAFHIALVECNQRIRTTIAWTFLAIVHGKPPPFVSLKITGRRTLGANL